LENGFAFLNPYGLPYLPGSGVKGVLRQAARELTSGDWGDAHGWRGDDEKSFSVVIQKKTVALSMCDVLFGRETRDGDAEHVRGVLSFWDVIPQIKGDSLHVEIMTPHQGHYYQQNRDRKTGDSVSPHESGQPIPIPFLTVPPGSGFAFHVVCDLPRLHRLAPELAQDDRWKTLLTAAFEHAFTWLGFGAKTAVGYGAMQRNQRAQSEREAALAESQRAAARAAMTEQQRAIEDFRELFEKARARGAHQPGSEFDAQRRAFFQTALAWTDPVERGAAAALLRETIAWSGWPGKKERKQEFRDWLAKLEGA
ncbi:type III-B CRISPR module RAMP protein Cmr6, partial [Immundisolibacter sp.]|uniref:type III-B CRISPR module RAMP protein Cmr6 n=1 Tax=Immundisolibacter sp. TaxID=1934948 RepID=UPI00262129D6